MSKPDKAAIQALVRRSLDRVLAEGPTAGGATAPAVKAHGGTLTESHLIEVQPGTTLEVPRGTIVTPSAREWALFKRIELVEEGAPATPVATPPSGASGRRRCGGGPTCGPGPRAPPGGPGARPERAQDVGCGRALRP